MFLFVKGGESEAFNNSLIKTSGIKENMKDFINLWLSLDKEGTKLSFYRQIPTARNARAHFRIDRQKRQTLPFLHSNDFTPFFYVSPEDEDTTDTDTDTEEASRTRNKTEPRSAIVGASAAYSIRRIPGTPVLSGEPIRFIHQGGVS